MLTQAQRDAWNLYGQNVPVVDKLGATIKLSGINQFVRSNAPRIQAGLDVIVDAPSVFNIGDTARVDTVLVSVADGINVVGAIVAPAAAGDELLIYMGRPANVGISYFRGPYRFMDVIEPDIPDGTFDTTTITANLPFAPVEDQRVFIRLQVSRADGRLSADAQGSAIVTA